MGTLLQLLIFSTIGVILVWFGYTLFFVSGRKPSRPREKKRRPEDSRRQVETGTPGDPRVCPVCSARLMPHERVKSAVFPGLPGQGRLMHIYGCAFCLAGSRRRSCPVCGAELEIDGILVARMFEKPGRSHVHVLGCSHCRGALAAGTRNPA